jgi:hypothetical protein
MDDEHVTHVERDGKTSLEVEAHDVLESEAKNVLVPGVGKQPVVLFEMSLN